MKENINIFNDQNLHYAFLVGIALKAIDGFFESIAGLLLFFIRPNQLFSFLKFLFFRELSQDPRDFIANFLINSAHTFTGEIKLFAGVFLLSHGIIKLLIIAGLWQKKMWTYPFGITVFIIFGIYQMYQYFISYSFWLIILTILDVFVILLTWHEYDYILKTRAKPYRTR